MTRPNPAPRWYFSLRSPYSWLAHHDLLTRYPDLAATVEWRPFWEPDQRSLAMLTEAGGRFPYVENSRPKARYILQDVRRLAAQRGLVVSWPVDRQPCWEVAHLAYLVARRTGHGPAFVARVYQARWQEGRDISDPATIAAIAGELGLPPAELAGAADHPLVRAEGLQALLAIDRDGVFGVPFFVLGFEKFWGVDRLALFAAAVREQASGSAGGPQEPAPEAEPAADLGHAGGCG